MKSNYELLVVLEDNFEEYFIQGLCGLVCALEEDDKVSKAEKRELLKIIRENRPAPDLGCREFSLFYWGRGEKASRKAWIKKMKAKYAKVIPIGAEIYSGMEYLAEVIIPLVEGEQVTPKHFSPEIPEGTEIEPFEVHHEGKLIYLHPFWIINKKP